MKYKISLIFSLSFLSFIFYFLYLPLQISAQENQNQTQILRVSPVIINVTLSPSKTYRHEITLENLTSAPLPVRAVFSDFEPATEDGGYVFSETRTNPLLSWTLLDKQEILLPAKSKERITLTITTPQSIPLGGYYGILFFEPVLRNNTEATNIATRVGILLLADIGLPDPKAKKAEILTFSLRRVIEPWKPLPVLLRVKNISLNFFTAKPILTLKPLVGAEKKIFPEEKVVFPGKVRRWQQDIALESLPSGFYNATIAVSTGNGQLVTRETTLLVFPYRMAILLLLLLLLTLFVLLRRKQLKKAVIVLLKLDT